MSSGVPGDAAWAREAPCKHRNAVLLLGATSIAATLLPFAVHAPLLLVWNSSRSAPLGLYGIHHERSLKRGDFVAVRLPRDARRLADKRRYLPARIPAIKRIAALAGDEVCAKGAAIMINGITVARRLARDPMKRPLPHWSGCHRLGTQELLLLNPAALSFDSRYFGAVATSSIIGHAVRLWPR